MSLIAFFLLLSAADAPVGAHIATVTATPLPNFDNEWTISITNKSPQPITAYSLAITRRCTDGQDEQHGFMADSVHTLALERLGWPVAANDRFGPGHRRTVNTSLATGRSECAGKERPVAAYLTMVAFADRTAIGQPAKIADLEHSRNAEARATSLLTEALQELVSVADPQRTLADMLSAIAAERANLQSRADISVQSELMALDHREMRLRSAVGPNMDDPRKLALVLKAETARLETLAEHARLNPQSAVDNEAK